MLAILRAVLLPGPLNRPTHREYLLLGLGLALLLSFYVWGAHHWIDLVDEGYFAYASSRVLAGDLPYRDFATPYTPGFFYLNATLFRLFGEDLLPPRFALCLARGGVLLLLYLLARRLMRPAFALIPLIVFIGQDPGPTYLEVHPAWCALLFSLLAVWCGVQALERQRVAWLVGAGLAAGTAFAFKQNAGLFTLLALIGLLLVERSHPDIGPAPRLVRALVGLLPSGLAIPVERLALAAFFGALLLLITSLMQPHLGLLSAIVLVAPVLALAGLFTMQRLAAGRSLRAVSAVDELAGLTWRLLLIGGGFGLITLLWLIPLLAALGPAGTPLAAFVGRVEQRGYFYPFGHLRLETLVLAVALLVVPLVLWRIGRSARRYRRALEGLIWLSGLVVLAAYISGRALSAYQAPTLDLLWLTADLTVNLVLYLPSLAFWPALWLLARGDVPPAQSRYLRWYLLAGSLLLLKQYPRMDAVHLLFAGPLLWLPGAYALSRLHRTLLQASPALARRPAGRSAAFAALLTLPLAAVWPSTDARFDEITGRDLGSLVPVQRTFVNLDLPGANVLINEEQVWQLRQVVARIQAASQPGQRIFVYPGAPLFYYLSDRPNATRFNHVFPGLLSRDDELQAIGALERTPAVLVIWDAEGALYWDSGGVHQRLTDYIWDNYEVQAEVGRYVVMGRKAAVAAAPTSAPLTYQIR
jgi:hypothetical protein